MRLRDPSPRPAGRFLSLAPRRSLSAEVVAAGAEVIAQRGRVVVSRVEHLIRWSVQDYRTCRARARSAVTNDPYLRLVYLELLNALPESGGELTADPEQLADVLLLPAAEIERCLPILARIGEIGRGGIVVDNGVIFNRRVKEDLAASLAYREEQAEKGKKGAKAKHSSGSGQAAAKQLLEESEQELDLPLPMPLPVPMPMPLPVPTPEPSGSASGASGVAFPLTLDVPAFRQAWSDLQAYRREANLRAWKPKTIRMKLAEMSEWGLENALEAIRRTIANGWQGVFDPRDGKSQSGPRRGGPPSPPTTKIPRSTE